MIAILMTLTFQGCFSLKAKPIEVDQCPLWIERFRITPEVKKSIDAQVTANKMLVSQGRLKSEDQKIYLKQSVFYQQFAGPMIDHNKAQAEVCKW